MVFGALFFRSLLPHISSFLPQLRAPPVRSQKTSPCLFAYVHIVYLPVDLHREAHGQFGSNAQNLQSLIIAYIAGETGEAQKNCLGICVKELKNLAPLLVMFW